MKPLIDDALKAAIKVCGTRYQLAKRIGLTRQAVYAWHRVPPAHWWAVSQACGIPMERFSRSANARVKRR